MKYDRALLTKGCNFFWPGITFQNGIFLGNIQATTKVLRMVIVLISLLVLTSEAELHYFHDADITKNLKLSQDVELNPGPYEIVRTVQGNFNEGNVALLGGSAG